LNFLAALYVNASTCNLMLREAFDSVSKTEISELLRQCNL